VEVQPRAVGADAHDNAVIVIDPLKQVPDHTDDGPRPGPHSATLVIEEFDTLPPLGFGAVRHDAAVPACADDCQGALHLI